MKLTHFAIRRRFIQRVYGTQSVRAIVADIDSTTHSNQFHQFRIIVAFAHPILLRPKRKLFTEETYWKQ